ncbi:hypothetical protein BDY21DRAFT_380584 [Lineolata rhizophorae]|uniref:SEP domain-containing protein n=1 Tax=Lineolata rhizophorae TaxID=578093 RepID=A0A6A6NVJ9_9PEZI|nr:hypothetical protein BDY21DRAFT_380584 [Lineolata rhizophorae]
MSSAPPGGLDRDACIAEFMANTDASASQAEQALSATNWDVAAAVDAFGAGATDPGDDDDDGVMPDPATSNRPPPTARTLGGDPVWEDDRLSAATSSARGPARQPQGGGGRTGGMRTLRDLQGGADDDGHGHRHGRHGAGRDDDGDEDVDFFAGGEKSGLAVQNPGDGGGRDRRGPGSARDQVENILERARRNLPRPGGDDPAPSATRRSFFTGGGHTLGGDDLPSQYIPDPSAPPSSRSPQQQQQQDQPPPRVTRTLHLWRDGYSVDDGPLFRFDDPANAATLAMINQGRAPLDILDVQQGQEVDLEVMPHREEDYKQPKKKYRPFGGQGQRLGSPTPGVRAPAGGAEQAQAGASPAAAPAVASQAGASGAAAASPGAPAGPQLDESQPSLTLQVRLGDGTRLQSRFNAGHTVGDVYDFVDASSGARSGDREYVLMTTFPSRELRDKGAVLGELMGRGGVVVQKWT